MKTLLLLTILFSVNAHAKMTATEALQLVLPENEYVGMDPFSEQCVVDVIREDGMTRIEMRNTGTTRFMVFESAPYEVEVSKEFFSTSIVVTTDANQTETTFFTERVDQFSRLVRFQRVFRVGDRMWTSTQKCTIEN